MSDLPTANHGMDTDRRYFIGDISYSTVQELRYRTEINAKVRKEKKIGRRKHELFWVNPFP